MHTDEPDRRCPSMPASAKLALTRRLAAVAQDFRGAPMVHDLAAAIEELMRDPTVLDGTAHATAEQDYVGAICNECHHRLVM